MKPFLPCLTAFAALTGCTLAAQPVPGASPSIDAPAVVSGPPLRPLAADAGCAPSAPEDAGVSYLDSAPAFWSDGGWETSIYASAATATFTGSGLYSETAYCNGANERLEGECAVSGGTLVTGNIHGSNGWICYATANDPAKGVTIVSVVSCRRPY